MINALRRSFFFWVLGAIMKEIWKRRSRMIVLAPPQDFYGLMVSFRELQSAYLDCDGFAKLLSTLTDQLWILQTPIAST